MNLKIFEKEASYILYVNYTSVHVTRYQLEKNISTS